MILNEIYKKPIITFGLGATEKTISLGETVKIHQKEIYNNDEYFLRYIATAKPIYGFELTPASAGTLNITCRIISYSGKVNIISNTISISRKMNAIVHPGL